MNVSKQLTGEMYEHIVLSDWHDMVLCTVSRWCLSEKVRTLLDGEVQVLYWTSWHLRLTRFYLIESFHCA